MPRKPWIIWILSLIYLLSPLAILVINSMYNMIPLWGPQSIWFRMTLWDNLVLGLYPILAVSIFTVKKTGWWIFVISSLVLILHNCISYWYNPSQGWFNLILYNVLLFLGAAILFRKQVIAPYFNPRLRWWEAEKRYSINFKAYLHLEGRHCVDIVDISPNGCFVNYQGEIPRSVEFPLELHLQDMKLHILAKGIRKTDKPFPGWGLKFPEISSTSLEGLHKLLEKLDSLDRDSHERQDERRKYRRITIPQWIHWDEGGITQTGKLINLSKTGCCVESTKKSFQGNVEYPLFVSDFDEKHELTALPIWENHHKGQHWNGLEFCDLNRKDRQYIKSMIHFFVKVGSHHRNQEANLNPLLIEKSLKQTPFPRLYRA